MLRTKDLIAARNLVYTANSRNLTIDAKDNTPLATLNRTLIQLVVPVDEEAAYASDEALSAKESRLQQVSIEPNAMGVEIHSVEMKTLSEAIAAKVGNSISFARNVVNPIVLEILEEAKKEQIRIVEGSELHRPLTQVSVSPVYSDSMLESMVERYRASSPDIDTISHNLAQVLVADITTEAYLETIRVGNPMFDDKVTAMFNLHNGETNQWLVSGRSLSDNITLDDKYPIFTDNTPLFNYLFLTGIRNGRLPSIDYSALEEEDKLAISKAIALFGRAVYRQMARIDDTIKNKIMIVQTADRWDATIYVVDELYSAFLDNGGSVEALMGFMSTQARGSYVPVHQQQKLAAAPEKYVEKYVRALSTENAGRRLEVATANDKVIRKVLYAYVNETYGEDAAVRGKVIARLENLLRTNHYSHTEALDNYALRLTCNIIANDQNDAFEIITEMRTYLNDNPEASPQTAALVAATQLIGKWLASQLEVTPGENIK